MRRPICAATACLLVALTSACVEPPVKPIPDAARRSVGAVAGEVSGLQASNTSTLGARGSSEGTRLGAAQGAAMMSGGGGLVGLVLVGVGAAVGAVKGSAEARSEDVVDATRTNLRIALQEIDFNAELRHRLATSKGAGDIAIVIMAPGSEAVPSQTDAGTPVGQLMTVEYRLGLYGENLVNPSIGLRVVAAVQVQSPDRRQIIHQAIWVYCGERRDFVQMAADDASGLRAQMYNAAAVLGEAIPYDLYVSRQPRPLAIKGACMDFADLPSGIGRRPGPARF
jgi:hypothetical protein